MECFKNTLNIYRKEGFQIAIDDLGAGFAGLKMLAELEPGMVKVDRFLISHIARSTKKRLLVESLVSFCHKINAQVVAEGIENREDLDVVLSMNIDLAQGFHLGPPAASATECSPSAKALILENRASVSAIGMDERRIGSLCQHATSVEADELTETIISTL